MDQTTDEFKPGQRVVITQQIPHHFEVWTSQFAGTIVRYEQLKTGSWFAHSKDHKLWLDRLVIRKDDGEIVFCNLDGYTHVELASRTGEASGAAAEG